MSEETTSKSTPELTPVSAFVPPTILFAGIAQGVHMVKNSIEQSLVLSNIWSPPKQARIGAFAATFRFPPGSVGSGTSGAIQAIHSVFGSFGEARIGNYFNLPMVQQFLAKPIGNIGVNTLVASGEYRYWCEILAVSYMHFLGDLKTFKLNFPALQTLAAVWRAPVQAFRSGLPSPRASLRAAVCCAAFSHAPSRWAQVRLAAA